MTKREAEPPAPPVYDECDILVVGRFAGHSAALRCRWSKNILRSVMATGGDVTGGYVIMEQPRYAVFCARSAGGVVYPLESIPIRWSAA